MYSELTTIQKSTASIEAIFKELKPISEQLSQFSLEQAKQKLAKITDLHLVYINSRMDIETLSPGVIGSLKANLEKAQASKQKSKEQEDDIKSMSKEIREFQKLSEVHTRLLDTTSRLISAIREKLHLIIEKS